MSFEGLTPVDDVSVGEWIAPRLCGFGGRVCSVIPQGYAAYARALHPATDQNGADATWAEVCRRTDRTPHALMQWRSIARIASVTATSGRWPNRRAWTSSTSEWPGEAPEEGAVSPALLTRLLDLLAGDTADDDCAHALWEGWGWLSEDMRAHPLLAHPHRNYLLFRGPLSAALRMGHEPLPDWFIPQSPSLLWPVDRSWCLATEIDFDSTLIGGTASLIDRLLQSPHLEAWAVEPTDDLSYAGDHINPWAGAAT